METVTEGRNRTEIMNDVKRLAEKIKPLIDETPEGQRLTGIGFVLTAETLIELATAVQDDDKPKADRVLYEIVNVCANIATNIGRANPEGVTAFLEMVTRLALEYSGAPQPRDNGMIYA
jgi:hypothetical protein